MKKNTEYVFDDKDNSKYEYVVTRRKKKKGNPFVTAIIVFLVIGFIGANSESSTTSTDATPTNTPVIASTATPTEVPTSTPVIIPVATATATPAATPTATPTNTPAFTNTPAPTATEDASFTVEHDEEYYATQEYIYKFLTEKGYEVQTIIGVPNVGRIEDNDPNDLTVPWYAYVMHKGKWTQFNVLLFNGEVSFIRPMQ